MSRFARVPGDFGHGGGCGEMRDTEHTPEVFLDGVVFDKGGYLHTPSTSGAAVVAAQHSEVYTAHGRPGTNVMECKVGTQTFTSNGSQLGSGINFAVWGATVAFRYLIVIK